MIINPSMSNIAPVQTSSTPAVSAPVLTLSLFVIPWLFCPELLSFEWSISKILNDQL